MEWSSWLWDMSVSGIDFSLAGNGGPTCRDFSTATRFWAEWAAGTLIATVAIYVGVVLTANQQHSTRKENADQSQYSSKDDPRFSRNHSGSDAARMLLLVAVSMVFGMQLVYKMASRQTIYILNPCHMLCIVHIVLLAAYKPSPSKWSTWLFRTHLYWMQGPLMASLLPVTNTLSQPAETTTYWVEHALLVIVPFYLLLKTDYVVGPASDFSHMLIAYGLWGGYNVGFLQALSWFTLANMNCMLCPAISDPFRGPNYRLYGFVHQFVLNALAGTLLRLMAKKEQAKTCPINGFHTISQDKAQDKLY